ncbi:MAG: hypothetical protein OWQ34_02905 [Thermoplasma acidophilum]|nr:hypothetical protein [Thermoplasma acidophilum]
MIDFDRLYTFAYSLVMHYLLAFKYVSYALIVGMLLIRKTYRTAYGGRFSRRSIFLSPFLYTAFSVAVSIDMRTISIVISAIAFILGVYVSFHTSRDIIFFTKNQRTYYKRPVWVVSIWSLAFIGRLTVIFFFPSVNGDVFSILLFFATGLIIGEAAHTVRKQRMATRQVRKFRLRIPGLYRRRE